MTALTGINLLSIAPERLLTDVANIHTVLIGHFHLVDFSLKYALHNLNKSRSYSAYNEDYVKLPTKVYYFMVHSCSGLEYRSRPPASEWPCNFITNICELVFLCDKLMHLCISLTPPR